MKKKKLKSYKSIIPDNKVASGGSAANSAVGFSFWEDLQPSLEGVKNDTLGIEYIKDMDDAGVKFTSNPSGQV